MESKLLHTIQELLNEIYVVDGQYLIEQNYKEDGTPFESCMEINKCGSDIEYLLYRFDDNCNNHKHPILFPYFKSGHDLNKNCDYIIFATNGDKSLYILLVELKSNQGAPLEQLCISETFVDFIIKRFKACGFDFTPILNVRKIGIKDRTGSSCQPKDLTKGTSYQYENNYLLLSCKNTSRKQPFSIRLDRLLV
ncbi:MAG: hypothetical protein IKQ48_03950 [Paludibacteraceae bacterium]|nr:hypothetical protein [Paludibacteraceae bacterium]